jgi:serine protease Do
VRFAQAGGLKPGAWVAVVGFSAADRRVAVTGRVCAAPAPGADAPEAASVEVAAPSQRGQSGSPVFNSRGELAGMISGLAAPARLVGDTRRRPAGSNPRGSAAVIPAEKLRLLVEKIEREGRIRRGWMGILIGGEGANGITVQRVEPDSPAEKAGIREGDRLLRMEGDEVKNGADLQASVAGRAPGTKIRVRVGRGDEFLDLEAVLGEQPEEPPEPPMPKTEEGAPEEEAEEPLPGPAGPPDPPAWPPPNVD